jgi:EF hand
LIWRKSAASFLAYGRIEIGKRRQSDLAKIVKATAVNKSNRVLWTKGTEESPMASSASPRAIILAAIFAAGMTSAAVAQTTATDPQPNTMSQTAPSESGGMAGQGQGTPDQSGMMPSGMMGRNMMQCGMMGGMPTMGMRGHIMKFMFAIADVDGDGALSFEEVTTIHKRIFDKVDANKDGKVSPEEAQAFMQQ